MAPISPILRKRNAPNPLQQRQRKKVRITPKDVSLDFLMSKDTGENYECHFAVQINPKAYDFEPGEKITPRNVDMASLRKAIVNNVRPYDRKYMLIHSFDTTKVIFRFNHEKWIKDATRSMRPKVHLSKFDKSFKLKKTPPTMLVTDYVRKPFEDFVVRKFKKWLEENRRKEEKWFDDLIPRSIRKRIRTAIRNMFDWEYDTQWNKVIATLKPIFIIALMYATGHIVKNIRKDNIKKQDRQEFSKKVKKNIGQFDKKRWRQIVKKNFV